jgi:voltage-gated potassium channel
MSFSAVRKLVYIFIALAAVAVIGTLGFHLIEGWSWFDSLYMVVITFTTVGYGEVHALSHAGRMFNIFLMLVGVGLVYFGIGAVTQTLMALELDKVFGRRKMERELDRISEHYIICGAGRVGRNAALELERSSVPFVVVESVGADVEKEKTWLTVVGDATQEKVLRQAHIERAKGLVAATTTDATNLYIVLTARTLNPSLKIIARASEDDAAKHLRKAGADTVISPYTFAGHRIAQHFLRPNVVDFLDIAVGGDGKHGEMVIEEILVNGKSRLAGTTVGNSHIHHEFGIMVLAIKRDGGPRFNPTANEPILGGDNLIVMGEAAKMPLLEKIAAAER